MENLYKQIEKMSQKELFKVIFTDCLTGVLNRRALYASEAFRAIAIIDLDSLKYVNDNRGRHEGDKYLIKLASILVQAFCKSAVYRISGDEFSVTGRCHKSLASQLFELQTEFNFFSFGTGKDLVEADRNLKKDKVQRMILGQRALRGELPVWLKEEVSNVA